MLIIDFKDENQNVYCISHADIFLKVNKESGKGTKKRKKAAVSAFSLNVIAYNAYLCCRCNTQFIGFWI